MPSPDKKAIIGWALYDWANSAFATTVLAGFFPIFFQQYWRADADPTQSTWYLGLANSTAGIVIVLGAPILGAIADCAAARKRFLAGFMLLGVLATACLAWVPQSRWLPAAVCFTLAAIGFSGGNIFYDALLTAVASRERADWVSCLGYGLGYLGGGLLFALNVVMSLYPGWFGFAGADSAVRFSFLTVALWWGLFSVPILLWVREPAGGRAVFGWTLVRDGWAQLRATLGRIRRFRQVFLFLLAYWFYMDGVDTIIRMAANYGRALQFETRDLILALLLVQLIGFPAALLYSVLGRRLGVKRAILLAIGVYLAVTGWAVGMDSRLEFYLLAVAIALVQGGIQALSRSYYCRLIPAAQSAEFFGFYNMLGKFAVVVGPLLVGAVGRVARHGGVSADNALRCGMGSVAILFLVGGILLCFVRPERAALD